MFKKLALKTKMMLGSCSPLVLLIVLSVLTYNSIGLLLKSNNWVDHTHEVIAEAKSIEAAAVDMETGMRGYLLAGKEDFLDPYNAGQKRFYDQIASLKKTVDDNPAQVKLLAETSNTIREWQEKVTEPTILLRGEIAKSKTMDDMRDLVGEAKGKKYFDKFRGQIKTFVDRERTLMGTRKAAAKNSVDVDELKKTAKQVDHTYDVIAEAKSIEAAAVDMETGMRGYLLAGKEEFLDPYKGGKNQFFGLIAGLQKTVDDNPAQVTLLEEIKSNIGEWIEKVTEPAIALRKDIGDAKSMNDMAVLIGEARGKKYFDKFRGQIATFTQRETALMQTRQADAAQTAGNTVQAIIWGTIIILVVAFVISWLLTRSITGPLNLLVTGLTTGAEQVSGAAGQVSSSSQSLAEGASEQAAAIEETSASMEEMTSMTNQNADNATQADSLMRKALDVITVADKSMDEMSHSMEDISKASEETSKIVKTIDEIAFQTNLLALNAAVEAARAGEAGAGFAVVADEVRNLAMRAAEAAKNTAELIEGIVSKVNSGKDIVTKTNSAFKEVAESSSKVGGLVGEISAASKEQATGFNQISQAITQMDAVTQQNSANAEESAAASEQLNSQAETMMDGVIGMRGLVEGAGSSSSIGRTQTERTAISRPGPTAASRPALTPLAAPARPAAKAAKGETKNNPENIIPMNNDDEFQDF